MNVAMDQEEVSFQTALQAAFGPRCSEFNDSLRGALRELYRLAHQDGRLAALSGKPPELEVGTPVDFVSLYEGAYIDNTYLRQRRQVRAILSIAFESVVLDGETGERMANLEVFSQSKFDTFAPYQIAPPPRKTQP